MSPACTNVATTRGDGAAPVRARRMLRLLFVWLALAALTVAPHAEVNAQATPEAAPAPETWDETLKTAQEYLQRENVDSDTLERIRAEVAAIRNAASATIERGSVEARDIQARLDALGPPPPEGETEAEDLASRRAQLNEALSAANEPVLDAAETESRTELLISEIDRRIRELSTQVMLRRDPMPIWPAAWITAAEDLRNYTSLLKREIARKLGEPNARASFEQALPLSLGAVLAALLLLFPVGTILQRRLESTVRHAPRRRRRWSAMFLSKILRFVLPGASALLVTFALWHIDIVPFNARAVVEAFPAMLLFMVGASWLGYVIFSPALPKARLLPLSDSAAAWCLRICQGLGIFLALELLLMALSQDYGFRPASISVYSTPTIALASLALWRLATLLPTHWTEEAARSAESGEEGTRGSGFLSILSWLMRLSAVLALALVLIGYVNLSRQAIVPMVVTIGMIGFGLVLFHLTMTLVGTLLGEGDSQDQDQSQEKLSLLPIGVVLILVMAFVPVLALIWGARPTDIAEAWRLLTNGVEFGDVRLSLDSVVMLVAVFTLGLLLTGWLQRILRVTVLPRTRMDPGARNALVTGLGYIGVIISGMVAVSAAGLNLSSLAVVAGALSLGIGFGLQTIVSNFVSGIILLVERPIKEGDWIEVAGVSGIVRKIAVRSTRIETFDRHDVIVPNQDLIAGTVKNMTLSSHVGRLILPVGVAYGSDLERTQEILLEAAKAHPGVLAHPEPLALFMGLGDSSLDFELRCYLRDVNDLISVQSDLRLKVYTELNKAGIEIPFPQRDLHIRDLDRLVTALGLARQSGAAAKPETDLQSGGA